jgi:hypothetical protein
MEKMNHFGGKRILINPVEANELFDRYDMEEYGTPVADLVWDYLSQNNIDLGSRGANSLFRIKVYRDLRRSGETWHSMYEDISINGMANSKMGRTIHQLHSSITRGEVSVTSLAESPLEPFAMNPYVALSLSMLLTLVLILVGCFVFTKKGGGKSVPNALQSLVEQIYDFVLNLVNEQIGGLSGNVKQKFFPCISVTFTFSLFRNPRGMIPFSFTVTSHFLITLALSFSIFIGITIVGFQISPPKERKRLGNKKLA